MDVLAQIGAIIGSVVIVVAVAAGVILKYGGRGNGKHADPALLQPLLESMRALRDQLTRENDRILSLLEKMADRLQEITYELRTDSERRITMRNSLSALHNRVDKMPTRDTMKEIVTNAVEKANADERRS